MNTVCITTVIATLYIRDKAVTIEECNFVDLNRIVTEAVFFATNNYDVIDINDIRIDVAIKE